MEYKAISQASYKFTSTRETTIQGADVLNSGFRFGTIKTTDNMVLQIAPSGGKGSHTQKNICEVIHKKYSRSHTQKVFARSYTKSIMKTYKNIC